MSAKQDCDVAVLGGGPAGCATALALARTVGCSVCIVDPGQARGPRVGETLLPDTQPLLDGLGVWQDFLAAGHEACLGSCSAWGTDALGYNDFMLNPLAKGWHLDRKLFDQLLLRHASACPDTQLVSAKLAGCENCGEQGFMLHLSGESGPVSSLAARFVVDATGHRAAFARRVGAKPRLLDRLMFVYGFFDATEASSALRLTMLESAESGWWYAAHLPNQRIAVAFATDPDILRGDELANEEHWFEQLLRTRHIAERLDGCRFLEGSLCVRPAVSGMLDTVAGARWLAAGDAAAVYDPLSAQGIHKALSDGILAADTIAVAIKANTMLSPEYGHAAIERFDEYRVNRNYYYDQERRWGKALFWQRRQQRRDLQAGEWRAN